MPQHVVEAPADPARTIPILPSLDIAATAQFYGGQLGFTAEVYRARDYLIVRRDAMELHFWLTDDRKLCEVSACYIRGGQVPALFAEFTERAVPGLSPFTWRPWSMKEFYVIDPHGNLLKFGCAEDPADPARPA